MLLAHLALEFFNHGMCELDHMVALNAEQTLLARAGIRVHSFRIHVIIFSYKLTMDQKANMLLFSKLTKSRQNRT